jgi:hypothetical protein
MWCAWGSRMPLGLGTPLTAHSRPFDPPERLGQTLLLRSTWETVRRRSFTSAQSDHVET